MVEVDTVVIDRHYYDRLFKALNENVELKKELEELRKGELNVRVSQEELNTIAKHLEKDFVKKLASKIRSAGECTV
ncbi:hypothetical protein ACI2JA_19670 [Alkalihalobacillus sp. NPDC078783]|uniref:hypothetical protein n=1 Tax=Streptomyces albidoflavus TaxID=1886 RepID=UPI0033DBE27C